MWKATILRYLNGKSLKMHLAWGKHSTWPNGQAAWFAGGSHEEAAEPLASPPFPTPARLPVPAAAPAGRAALRSCGTPVLRHPQAAEARPKGTAKHMQEPSPCSQLPEASNNQTPAGGRVGPVRTHRFGSCPNEPAADKELGSLPAPRELQPPTEPRLGFDARLAAGGAAGGQDPAQSTPWCQAR